MANVTKNELAAQLAKATEELAANTLLIAELQKPKKAKKAKVKKAFKLRNRETYDLVLASIAYISDTLKQTETTYEEITVAAINIASEAGSTFTADQLDKTIKKVIYTLHRVKMVTITGKETILINTKIALNQGTEEVSIDAVVEEVSSIDAVVEEVSLTTVVTEALTEHIQEAV